MLEVCLVPERYTVTIRELPTNERPRERLLHQGAASLSNSELLAIQLRIGTQERSALGLAELLIARLGGLRGVATATVEELSRVKGIGPAKAAEILAAIELGRRVHMMVPEDRPTICSPQDVVNLLQSELRDASKEHFKSLLLNAKNQVVKVCTVSVGTLDSSLVHPREVFKDAINASAAAIIVAHNHPSGDPAPSAEDRRITQRLFEAGELLGIDLLDSVIIGDGRWVSLKQLGAL
jgi:DNA repair protein RadC